MGRIATEPLNLKDADELVVYLMKNHSVYAQVEDQTYYITDVNDSYWRAQDTTKLNEKQHYVDCSELVPTLSEFVNLPFIGEKSIVAAFADIVFFASVKDEA